MTICHYKHALPCHSERSEESAGRQTRLVPEILRCAQNDRSITGFSWLDDKCTVSHVVVQRPINCIYQQRMLAGRKVAHVKC